MKVKNLSFDKNGEFRTQKFLGGKWYEIIIYRVGRRFKKWIKCVGHEYPICDCFISANLEITTFFD